MNLSITVISQASRGDFVELLFLSAASFVPLSGVADLPKQALRWHNLRASNVLTTPASQCIILLPFTAHGAMAGTHRGARLHSTKKGLRTRTSDEGGGCYGPFSLQGKRGAECSHFSSSCHRTTLCIIIYYYFPRMVKAGHCTLCGISSPRMEKAGHHRCMRSCIHD